jgi:hypothetical protein
MSGKGDAYRPVDREKYASNWDRIFAIKEDRDRVLHPQSLRKKDCVKHLQDQTEKAVDRCPNTIDIEEQIEQDRGTD